MGGLNVQCYQNDAIPPLHILVTDKKDIISRDGIDANQYATFILAMKKLRIACFGTPQLSVYIFEEIKKLPFIEVIAVVTAPDRPAGRGRQLTPPPMKIWGEENNIPVFQPEKMSSAFAKKLVDKEIDLFLVISFGKIFSKKFLDAAPEVWNLHFSLLPKYRGASPVQSAILAGEKESGVTVFQITPGMDSGPVLAQQKQSIEKKYADEVFSDMEKSGAILLADLLKKLSEKNKLNTEEQDDSEAMFCHFIEKQDGFLDPTKVDAKTALQKIRAFFPWPGTWITLPNGKRLKIIRAQESERSLEQGEFLTEKTALFLGFINGSIELQEVQIEGKKAVSGEVFGRNL